MNELRVAYDDSYKPIKIWIQDSDGEREYGGVELTLGEAIRLMIQLGRSVDQAALRGRGIA